MSRPVCSDGACGADDCARCGAGDEGVFVPGVGKRGPKGPRAGARLLELRAQARAGALTTEEDFELSSLESDLEYLRAEDERREAEPARPVRATSVDDAGDEAAAAQRRAVESRASRRAAYAYESETVRASRYAEWLDADERTAGRQWFEMYSDPPVPAAIVELAAGYLRRRRERKATETPTAVPSVEAAKPPPPMPKEWAIGMRVICLAGPPSKWTGGVRGLQRAGAIVGWRHPGLEVLYDGDKTPVWLHPSRVSPINAWGVNPVHPERVTWLVGQAPPIALNEKAWHEVAPDLATMPKGKPPYPGFFG